MMKNFVPIPWKSPSEEKIESLDYRQIRGNKLQKKKKKRRSSFTKINYTSKPNPEKK